MPRFYMHLRSDNHSVIDDEGIEMPAAKVADVAIVSARDCIAADVRTGHIDLRYRIDVHDEQGRLVHSTPFRDAVRIIT